MDKQQILHELRIESTKRIRSTDPTKLTEAEFDAIDYAATGATQQAIASKLGIALSTFNARLRRARAKLDRNLAPAPKLDAKLDPGARPPGKHAFVDGVWMSKSLHDQYAAASPEQRREILEANQTPPPVEPAPEYTEEELVAAVMEPPPQDTEGKLAALFDGMP